MSNDSNSVVSDVTLCEVLSERPGSYVQAEAAANSIPGLTSDTSASTHQASAVIDLSNTVTDELVNPVKEKTPRKPVSQSEIWEDSTGLVRVSTHVNGTFDVLYKTPQVSVPVWDHMVLAVLHGVIMALSNDGNKPESICRYKDPADTSRAATFMTALMGEFPEFGYEKVLDLGDGLARVLGGTYSAMSAERKNQLSATFQSILVSGSVLKNEIDQASGLVTMAAQFGEKVLKVRLTGKIPVGIAGTLRVPYQAIQNNTATRSARVYNNSTRKPVVKEQSKIEPSNSYENLKQDLTALLDTATRLKQTLLAEMDSIGVVANNVPDGRGKVKVERKPRFQDGKFDTSGDKFTNANELSDSTRAPSSKAKGGRGKSNGNAGHGEKFARGMTPSIQYMDDSPVASSGAGTLVTFDTAAVVNAVKEHVQRGDVHAALGDPLPNNNKQRKSYTVGDEVKSAFADKLKNALQSK